MLRAGVPGHVRTFPKDAIMLAFVLLCCLGAAERCFTWHCDQASQQGAGSHGVPQAQGKKPLGMAVISSTTSPAEPCNQQQKGGSGVKKPLHAFTKGFAREVGSSAVFLQGESLPWGLLWKGPSWL